MNLLLNELHNLGDSLFSSDNLHWEGGLSSLQVVERPFPF